MFGSDLMSPPFGCRLNEWGCGGSPVIAGNGALKVKSPSLISRFLCVALKKAALPFSLLMMPRLTRKSKVIGQLVVFMSGDLRTGMIC